MVDFVTVMNWSLIEMFDLESLIQKGLPVLPENQLARMIHTKNIQGLGVEWSIRNGG